jgi:hypothetical protein
LLSLIDHFSSYLRRDNIAYKYQPAGTSRVGLAQEEQDALRLAPSLQDLRQVSTYQIAPFVQAECIAPRAVAVKLFLLFHQIGSAAVFLDDFADTIAAFAGALGAFDAEHVELVLDVAKDEISSPTHDGDITTGLAVAILR